MQIGASASTVLLALRKMLVVERKARPVQGLPHAALEAIAPQLADVPVPIAFIEELVAFTMTQTQRHGHPGRRDEVAEIHLGPQVLEPS